MPSSRPLRVLIVDDEPLARQRVEDMLRASGDIVVGTADSGPRAIDAIRALAPDLVFLDVQMPGKTGLEVVREIGVEQMPATIFVTAYDRHAIDAFDMEAVDYLVKPFDDERFEQALARARRRIELEEGERREARDERFLERIPVESRGKVRVVPVHEIDYIVSSGPYAELQVGDRKHIIRESMQNLEDRLDPVHFIRIHRSTIVRLDLIDSLLRAPGGDYEVELKNGVRLRVSRSRREELERRLGM